LRKVYRKKLLVHECRIPSESRAPASKRWFITIHQPKKETLIQLQAIPPNTFVIHATHIAVDFLCPEDGEASHMTEFLTRHVVQKWRRRGQQSCIEENTRYWNPRKKRRNIALYGDKPSKTRLGPCCHFELRFTTAEGCKRVGLGDLPSIIGGIDPIALLKHQTKICFIDPKRLDRAIERIARANVRLGTRPGKTVDDYKRLARRLLARVLQDDDYPLDEHSLAKARAQSLWDRRRSLRGCLVNAISWDDLIPYPILRARLRTRPSHNSNDFNSSFDAACGPSRGSGF
jgi:hypothetical protein